MGMPGRLEIRWTKKIASITPRDPGILPQAHQGLPGSETSRWALLRPLARLQLLSPVFLA